MTETLHIYTRVSTGEQESNTSIEGQKKKGIKLAEQCQRTKDDDEPCALLAPKPRGHPEFRSQVAAPDASL